MPISSNSYEPTIELELLSPTRHKLLLMAAHLPLLMAGLGAGWPWMGWVFLILLISLASHLMLDQVRQRRLLLYPSGAGLLLDLNHDSVPVRMLAGQVLGARMAILNLASASGRQRVLILRHGQETMYRLLCRRLYGLPETITATGPNGRRSAARSVV